MSYVFRGFARQGVKPFFVLLYDQVYYRGIGSVVVNTFAGLLANMYTGKQVYVLACLPTDGFADKPACMFACTLF